MSISHTVFIQTNITSTTSKNNKLNIMSENSVFRYLSPGLISENDMREELKSKGFKIKWLERKSKEDLTEIFVRHLMPLPQRNFPNNHHGKLLNQMIRKENLKSRKCASSEEGKSNLQYGFQDKKGGPLMSSQQLSKGGPASCSGSRIKPPLDSSELQNKKICLVNTTKSPFNSIKDRVVINDMSKERRKSNDSDSEIQKKSGELTQSKTVELKRKLSSSEKCDDAEPSKKGRQRIAWP